MKKSFAIIALIVIMAICTTAFAADVRMAHAIDPAQLTDCTVRAGFNIANVTDQSITVNIFEEVVYDIVDISNLQVGDTLETADGDITVTTIETDENGAIDVNGGQYEEGGATLCPDADTNGYLQTDFEYTAIAERGTAVIPLADQVILNVFQMDDDFNVAEEGYDTETVSAGEVRAVLARTCELTGDDFYPYQTTIRIENGAAVEITVDYMP